MKVEEDEDDPKLKSKLKKKVVKEEEGKDIDEELKTIGDLIL